jgi:hypothetical protein
MQEIVKKKSTDGLSLLKTKKTMALYITRVCSLVKKLLLVGICSQKNGVYNLPISIFNLRFFNFSFPFLNVSLFYMGYSVL